MTLAGTGRQGPDPEKLFDEEWVAAFLDDVSGGVPILVAAEANGLNRWTFYRYLQHGGHPSVSSNELWIHPDEAREPYKSFVQATVQAEAGAHRDIVKTIHSKVGNDMNVAVRYLRTRYAEQYDPRNTAPIVGVDVSEGAVQTVTLSLADFDRLRERKEGNNDA